MAMGNIKARRQRNIKPAKLAELIVHAWGLEMNNKALVYVFDVEALKRGSIKRMAEGSEIHCECGSHQEIGGMVRCAFVR